MGAPLGHSDRLFLPTVLPGLGSRRKDSWSSRFVDLDVHEQVR